MAWEAEAVRRGCLYDQVRVSLFATFSTEEPCCMTDSTHSVIDARGHAYVAGTRLYDSSSEPIFAREY